MSGDLNSNKLHKEPFVVNNQIYILGNPVVSAQTLDQLVHALDQLGDTQPIVIINPEATTVPNFENMLSNLIQNNRATMPLNVTTNDKYAFKDVTDEQLKEKAQEASYNNPAIIWESLYELYQGMRSRASLLYAYDSACAERDALWAAHCANPQDNSGSERYGELYYYIVPNAWAAYQQSCASLEELEKNLSMVDSTKVGSPPVVNTKEQPQPAEVQTQQPVAATSSCSNTILNTTRNSAVIQSAPIDNGLVEAKPLPDNEERIKMWGVWTSARYMKMPLTTAKQMAGSPGYNGLRQQQRDVVFNGTNYQAVPPEILLALGLTLIPDGIPIVYNSLGKFMRVGNSEQPPNNLKYWYPQPEAY